MQCQNCSQELIAGSAFCGNCGAKILNAAPPQPNATPTTNPPVNAPTATPPATTAPLTPATPVIQPQSQPVAQMQQPAPANSSATYAVPSNNKSKMSTVGLICGIISVISFLFWPLAVLLGITAIILSGIGISKGSKGMGIAGVILGVVGIIASIVTFISVVQYCDDNPFVEGCADVNAARVIVPNFLRK